MTFTIKAFMSDITAMAHEYWLWAGTDICFRAGHWHTMHSLCLDWMKHVAFLSAHSISVARTLPTVCLIFFVLKSHLEFNDYSSDNRRVQTVTRSEMKWVFGACVLCVQLNLQWHWFSILFKIAIYIIYETVRYVNRLLSLQVLCRVSRCSFVPCRLVAR